MKYEDNCVITPKGRTYTVKYEHGPETLNPRRAIHSPPHLIELRAPNAQERRALIKLFRAILRGDRWESFCNLINRLLRRPLQPTLRERYPNFF